jgi:hypothetical protein
VVRLAAFGCLLGSFALGCANESSRTVDAQFDADTLPALVLEEELRIGSIDDPDRGFSSIGSADVDEDGNLYVFEAQDAQIRVYDEAGVLVRRIGRGGNGPGEFSTGFGGGMVGLGVVGDTVWTYQWSSGRLSLFDRSGRLLSAARLERVVVGRETTGFTVTLGAVALGANGYFLGDRHPASLPALFDVAGDSIALPHVRFDAQGSVVDTAGWYAIPVARPEREVVDVGASQYLTPAPPGTAPIVAIVAGGRIVIEWRRTDGGDAGVFRVTRRDFAGDTVFTRTFRYRPVAFPDAVLDSAARRAARGTGTVTHHTATGQSVRLQRHAADSAAARSAIRDRLAFPEFQPPVRSYRLGEGGSLWLQREDTGADSLAWTVLDADGLPVGNLWLPRSGRRFLWSDGRILWAVEPDALDVPWLVRYRIIGSG